MTLNKTDRIVITLGKQIVHGKYVPGSPLPAEAELCEEFATSRNIIREVFRSLMAKRLIEMKRYRGAFVAPRVITVRKSLICWLSACTHLQCVPGIT